MSKNKFNFSKRGFTLVELLVVIAILSGLALMAVAIINPVDQLNKAKDAQRKQDLGQIKNALDTYYDDNHCYPQTIPFGSSWETAETVYMKKVPQDPDCNKTGYCYGYQIDTNSSCPQWNILYTRLSKKPPKTEDWCVNVVRTVCENPHLSFNLKYSQGYCALSGKPDCLYLQSNPLQTPTTPTPTPAGGGGGGGGTPTSTPTPTSIPTGGSCINGYYAVSPSSGKCNSVSANNCTIFGGSLVCYSAGSLPGDDTHCSGLLCSQ